MAAPNMLMPANLPERVSDKFRAARAAGELTFWPTEVAILHLNGLPVRRLRPASTSRLLIFLVQLVPATVLSRHCEEAQVFQAAGWKAALQSISRAACRTPGRQHWFSPFPHPRVE